MEKRNIRIKLTFSDNTPSSNEEEKALYEAVMSGEDVPVDDTSEFVTDAELVLDDRCDLIYAESEELGMGNSTIKISWLREDPLVITIMRTGDVETVMAFEPGRRHISAYNMPGMAFELCTHTLRAENTFDGSADGIMYLDYIIEIRGGFAGRRKMKIELLPSID